MLMPVVHHFGAHIDSHEWADVWSGCSSSQVHHARMATVCDVISLRSLSISISKLGPSWKCRTTAWCAVTAQKPEFEISGQLRTRACGHVGGRSVMLLRNDGERNGTDGRMAQTGNDRPIYTNMSAKVSVHATKGESAPKLPSSKREKMLAFERKMNEVGKVLLCSAWLQRNTHFERKWSIHQRMAKAHALCACGFFVGAVLRIYNKQNKNHSHAPAHFPVKMMKVIQKPLRTLPRWIVNGTHIHICTYERFIWMHFSEFVLIYSGIFFDA